MLIDRPLRRPRAAVQQEPGEASTRDGYTVQEFAARWQVSPRTVERAIARGEIKAIHIGRTRRIPASELERLAAGEDSYGRKP